MRSTQQFSITLPKEMAELEEMAELVRSKVAASQYSAESEVIRYGLGTLAVRDKTVEVWLRDQVVPAAKALQADPSLGIPVDQVRTHFAQKRARSGQSSA